MNAEDRLIACIRVPMVSHDLEVNGAKVRVMTAGSGETILLMHGLNIGWGEWYAVIPELIRHHRVIAVDFPGSGASDKIDFPSADVPRLWLDAADAALKAFAPAGAVVVGHSLGGWAALKLAARRHPLVKGVVAISVPGLTPVVPTRFWPLMSRRLAGLLSEKAVPPTTTKLREFLTDVMVDRSALSSECVEYVVEHVNRSPVTHPFLLIHRTIQPFRLRPEFMFTDEELEKISCPTTIVHGREDPLIPLASIRDSVSRIPGVRTVILDGVGHVPPIERPGAIMESVNNLMTGIFARS